jgi:hypothetical protein
MSDRGGRRQTIVKKGLMAGHAKMSPVIVR